MLNLWDRNVAFLNSQGSAPATDPARKLVAAGGPRGTGSDASVDTATAEIAVAAVVPASADSSCHPSYNSCLPRVRDLDCPEIGHRVTVIGADVYRLDANDDGTGCDHYPEPAEGR